MKEKTVYKSNVASVLSIPRNYTSPTQTLEFGYEKTRKDKSLMYVLKGQANLFWDGGSYGRGRGEPHSSPAGGWPLPEYPHR
jgi:hypothetical protein